MSPRLIATRLIQTVLEQEVPLTQALNDDTAFQKAGEQRAWIQELCYGTLRWYLQLESVLGQLLDKPIRKKDRVLHYLLLTGLYQIKYMKDPVHAIVSETVAACRQLKKESAKGLVNAILRRYLREREKMEARLHDDPVYATAHPQWFIAQLKKDWPGQYQQILEANNQRPPMTLRINRLKTSRESYLQRLGDSNIEATPTRYSEEGMLLATPCHVEQLPGFAEGDVSVQDEAAQLACPLLQLEAGQTVLDGCAAPGGKSAHILESVPGLKQVILVEKEQRRAEKIRDNLQRLRLEATLKTSDLLKPDDWWNGQPFDRILLDVPCSATGVIRRHPDIKLLRDRSQVDTINRLQKQLLHTAWQTLKTEGILVYATCSVLRQENSDTIKDFMATNPDCEVLPIQADWGLNTDYGFQVLPGTSHMDGFFYAVLRKKRT